jgi:hypothetical protein
MMEQHGHTTFPSRTGHANPKHPTPSPPLFSYRIASSIPLQLNHEMDYIGLPETIQSSAAVLHPRSLPLPDPNPGHQRLLNVILMHP